MKTREVSVTDALGTTCPATLTVCMRCDSDAFHIYSIGEHHTHLQCAACGASYCQQSALCVTVVAPPHERAN